MALMVSMTMFGYGSAAFMWCVGAYAASSIWAEDPIGAALVFAFCVLMSMPMAMVGNVLRS